MEPPECMTILHSLAEEGKKYTVPVCQLVYRFLSLWISGGYQGNPEPNFRFRNNRTSLEYRVKALSSNLQSVSTVREMELIMKVFSEESRLFMF